MNHDDQTTPEKTQIGQAPPSVSTLQATNTVIQPASAYLVETPKRSKRKTAFMVLGVVFIASVAVGATYVITHSDEKTQSAPRQNTSKPKEAYTPDSNIPKYLLESSGSSNGITIGYVKQKEKTTSRSLPLEAVANAEDLKVYEPVLFYSDSQNIKALSTVTKQAEPAYEVPGSNPVFSSLSQNLAYEKQTCVVEVKNFDTKEVVAVATGEVAVPQPESTTKDKLCYAPIAWSPDGTKLAISASYSVNSAEMGLVGFTDLYIYDTTRKDLRSFPMTDGFNTVESYTLHWRDAKHILVQTTQRGKMATTVKTQISDLDLEGQKMTKFADNNTIDPASIQTVGEQFFVIANNPRILKYGTGADSSALQSLDATKNIGSYLLITNPAATRSTGILMLNGQAGSQDSFKLYRVGFENEAQSGELYNIKGFSAYFLGWGKDFNEVIYRAGLSGKSEIQLYNIEKNTMEVLVPDLPLG